MAYRTVQNIRFLLIFLVTGGVAMALPGTAAFAAAGSATEPGMALFQALGFAFLGGLILNLMPCVFPVLSMKALSLCKLSDQEERTARWHGLEYTAGVMVSFAVIAAVLMALKAGGAQIGWGFHLQNPMVVLFLAYVLFAIGLNFSGFFEIKAAFSSLGNDLTRPDKIGGSFFTGVLATFVAAPCTAPFMGAAMGFAFTQPAAVGVSIFLALGLGLAFPYLLLSFVPALRRVLPRPGPWMVNFREFLAFPMYGSAIWLVWVLGQQWGLPGMVKALAGMLTLVFALWLVKKAENASSVTRYTLWAVSVIAVLSAFFSGCAACTAKPDVPKALLEMALGAESSVVVKKATGEAEAFSQERLEALLIADDPVFVNMTAAWCITCKANERVALGRPEIKALFASQNVFYLKGDWTNQDPMITAYLDAFGRQGVPLYVYYGRRDPETGQRPDPHVLPQILTPGIIRDVVR